MYSKLFFLSCLALAGTVLGNPNPRGLLCEESPECDITARVKVLVYEVYSEEHYDLFMCLHEKLHLKYASLVLRDLDGNTDHEVTHTYGDGQCYKFGNVRLPYDGMTVHLSLNLGCHGHVFKTLQNVTFDFTRDTPSTYFQCNDDWFKRTDSYERGHGHDEEKCLHTDSKACYSKLSHDDLAGIKQLKEIYPVGAQNGDDDHCHHHYHCDSVNNNADGHSIYVCQPSRWQKLEGEYLRWAQLDYAGYMSFNYSHEAPAVTEAILVHKGAFSVTSATKLEVAIDEFQPSTDTYSLCAVRIDPHCGPIGADHINFYDVGATYEGDRGDAHGFKFTNIWGDWNHYYVWNGENGHRVNCTNVKEGETCHNGFHCSSCNSFNLYYMHGANSVVVHHP